MEERNQTIDPKEREKSINSILYDKFFALDAYEGDLKTALTERLNDVKKLFGDSPKDYGVYSMLAVSSIYAIEKDEKTAQEHRSMLLDLWRKDYQAVCGGSDSEDGEDDSEDEDFPTNDYEYDVRAILEKTIVSPAKCSVSVDVSYDESGKVSYTYSSNSPDIRDAADNIILLPAWRIVDADYWRRWIILHDKIEESKMIRGEEDETDGPAEPFFERVDMDLSDLLQGFDADEFESSDEDIKPGESYDFSCESMLPGFSFWMPDAGDIFAVRYYRPYPLRYFWYKIKGY